MPEQYVKTTDIKTAVSGLEETVLDQVVPAWRQASPHIDCPYPEHGGKDDWRWNEKRKQAVCTCTQPKADSIFDVVAKCEEIDFEQAKVRIAEMIARPDLIKEKTSDAGGRRYQKTDAASLLSPPNDNCDGGLPAAYLGHRLGVSPPDVMMPISRVAGHKELAYYDPPTKRGGSPVVVASPPCAVFETRDVAGKRHAHRIYLAPGGAGKADLGFDKKGNARDPKKSAKLLIEGENTAGRSVFWGDPRNAPWIIVAEGIETAAAVAFAFRPEIAANEVSVAAAISTSGLMAFGPWEPTKRITVAADRDEASKPDRPNVQSRAGEHAARTLCLKHYKTIETSIAMPGVAGEGVDWLEIHKRDGLAAVRAGILGASRFRPTLDEESSKVESDDRAAELAEISGMYPLPQLNSLQLAYGHTPSGHVFIHKIVQEKKSEPPVAIPVASPFGVVARLRKVNDADAYGLRVTVKDLTGDCRQIDFPRGDLAKQGAAEVRSALFTAGLRTEADGDGIVLQCLKAAHPSREIAIVAQPSWHTASGGAPPIFISPAGAVIGAAEDIDYELAAGAKMPDELAAGGSFDGWKAAVGQALAVDGCEHWALGIMAGFAGPLISLTGLDTCGLNLSGQSSGGKSTAQRLAVSAWSTPNIGKAGLFQSARASDNSTEALAARADGTVLALDELALVDGKMLGKLIYMIAGGVGKKRLKADTSMRASYRWSTFTLLSAECSLEEKVTSGGGEWMAGMAVRILDIDITGINRNVPPETLQAIEKIDEHYGHAGPAFIQTLVDNSLHRRPTAMRDAIKAAADDLAGPGADAAVRRSAEALAVVGVAGGIAQEAEILPKSINIPRVIGWAWARFRSSSNAAILNPDEAITLKVRTWIAERWNVTIRHVEGEAGNREAVAWYDKDAVYIPKERLREASGGMMKEVAVAKILAEAKHLLKQQDAAHRTVPYVPKIGKVTAYALDRSHYGRSDAAKPYGFNVIDGGLGYER